MMGWLTGWKYRKKHTINPATDAGTGYQIWITTYYGSGTDSGKNTYLGGRSRSDFGDIRFTKSDGVTLLPYALWNKVDGSYADWWVKITDDLSTTAVDIYIYFGNPDATTTQSWADTFIFFDDFDDGVIDTTKWTTQGTVAETGGFLQITGNGSWNTNGAYSKQQFDRTNHGYRIMMRAKVPVTTMDAMLGYGPGPINYQDGIHLYFEGTGYFYRWRDNVGLNLGVTYAANTEYYLEICLKKGATGYRLKIDGVEKENDTTFADNLHRIAFNNYEAGQILYVNYVFVTKYVDPEPTHGAWYAAEAAIEAIDKIGALDSAVAAKIWPLTALEKLGLLDGAVAAKIWSLTALEKLGLLDSTVMAKRHVLTALEEMGLLDRAYARRAPVFALDRPDHMGGIVVTGAEAVIPIDIQVQSIGNLGISIKAVEVSSLPIDIVAQSLATMKVDITAQTLSEVGIQIKAQTVGVSIQETWQSQIGNQRFLGVYDAGIGPNSTSHIIWYDVPSGKKFYIRAMHIANEAPQTGIEPVQMHFVLNVGGSYAAYVSLNKYLPFAWIDFPVPVVASGGQSVILTAFNDDSAQSARVSALVEGFMV